MTDSAHFLKALESGNSNEIRILYQTSFPKIRAFVMKNKGNEYDAEDIFQKALLQIAVRYKKEKFIIKKSFEGYLYIVCRNLWRRELNKSKGRVTKDNLEEHYEESTDMALALMEQKRWELFEEKLTEISENCRKILTLFFNKASYAHMVEVMEYNSETVARQRVFKCKAKLKQLILGDKRSNVLKQL
ncbi:RNA polymerase sigma factor [Ulvibacter litoralis]|uniref:RNA polymerase sigma factor, sigma-70 family n=1 Tax=Ulvibacter litoralis TaxID=227084 RepID=A0A1G7D2W5_9FLAO|nr:sigma-70 family RNA polymerase sigma factor [Ulvibacter litoralis]SDE45380.1 RNA polymerase sigma factor, sigma-70 family [Ulvibacter litoralis]